MPPRDLRSTIPISEVDCLTPTMGRVASCHLETSDRHFQSLKQMVTRNQRNLKGPCQSHQPLVELERW